MSSDRDDVWQEHSIKEKLRLIKGANKTKNLLNNLLIIMVVRQYQIERNVPTSKAIGRSYKIDSAIFGVPVEDSDLEIPKTPTVEECAKDKSYLDYNAYLKREKSSVFRDPVLTKKEYTEQEKKEHQADIERIKYLQKVIPMLNNVVDELGLNK